jgi:hypothetical protein
MIYGFTTIAFIQFLHYVKKVTDREKKLLLTKLYNIPTRIQIAYVILIYVQNAILLTQTIVCTRV